jgi:tryptophan synthase alpha chain
MPGKSIKSANRLVCFLEKCRADHKKAFIGYMTAGDPTLAQSQTRILAALENGIDILELGVPFSDPTADGPVIQAAALRSLNAGANLPGIIKLVARLRKKSQAPIVLFGYANPFTRYGYEKLCRDASRAGADAFLVVDLPFEEQMEMNRYADKYGMLMIPLIAPTTPRARSARILRKAEGFVYYVMVTGVTGQRSSVATDLSENLRSLRSVTSLPIAAGFGVSNGKQARQAARFADAVVVGSALVDAARRGKIVKLVREIRSALDKCL